MSSLFPQQEKFGQRQIDFYQRSRPDVVSLALLVCLARKIEPELLRHLRLKFSDYFSGDKKPHVGTESALWFSTLVESRGADGVTLLPGVLNLLRRQLKKEHSELLEKIRLEILICHESVPPVVRWEEDLVYYSLSTKQTAGHQARLRSSILEAAKAILSNKREGLDELINRMPVRVPAELFRHEDFKKLLSLSQSRVVKVLTPSTAKSSADLILQIKKGEAEIEIGSVVEDADFQIGVPKTTPVTVVVWNSSDPDLKQSQIIPPDEKISVSFTSDDDHIFLRTTDQRFYQIPLNQTAKAATPDTPVAEPKEPLRRLNEVRMIVVGDGGVGKTSLITRLVKGIYQEKTSATHGFRIIPWKIEMNGEDILVRIQDLGGQEIVHGLDQIFFTRRGIYLLVIDASLDFSRADYWLKMIESIAGNVPVIIVINKSDLTNAELDERVLTEKYPMIREFVRTEFRTETDLHELRNAIEYQISEMPGVRDLIPPKWLAIKEALINFDQKYITHEEYEILCTEYGEIDKRARTNLALYLRDLGYILYFSDDLFLSQTIVLDPEWLTKGIYRILNSEIVLSRRGEVWAEDLREILSKDEFPIEQHRFLLEVMQKFELCFSFPDDRDRYLIPDLLRVEEPAEAAEFRWEEGLNFEYQYETFLPVFLMRFIVRMHNYVVNPGTNPGLIWRRGVILSVRSCRVLVKSDTESKKILIMISGEPKLRRDCLSFIRAEFDRIHQSYSELNIREMIPLPDRPDITVSYDHLLNMEKLGKKTFIPPDESEAYNVEDLLNGVTRPRRIDRRLRVFCSYSYKDKFYFDDLKNHMDVLVRENLIEIWDEPKGENWQLGIEKFLKKADIILLLLSPNHLASKWSKREIEQSIKQVNSGEAALIPILLDDLPLTLPIADFQVLPKNSGPVSAWKDREAAWAEIMEEIRKVINHKLNANL
jgi:internalin A